MTGDTGPGGAGAAGGPARGAELVPAGPEQARRQLVLIGRADPASPREFFLFGWRSLLLALFPVLLAAGLRAEVLPRRLPGPVAAVLAAGLLALLAVAIAGVTARFVRDFGRAQHGWLEGSVLTVRRGRRISRCDLASAAVIKLGSTLSVADEGALPVLTARQHPGGRPVRLVLRDADLHPLPPVHLRLIAQAIESRTAPPDKKISAAAQRLREVADKLEKPDAAPFPVDWSHRTDPEGLGRPGR